MMILNYSFKIFLLEFSMSVFRGVLRRTVVSLHQLFDLVVIGRPLWDYTNSCIQFRLLRQRVIALCAKWPHEHIIFKYTTPHTYMYA